jgi:pimeloyl-ACP methyl ester carboxylesterase
MGPAGAKAMEDRATTALSQGMAPLSHAVPSGALSKFSLEQQRLVYHFVRHLVLNTDPSGYAAACRAIAEATSDVDYTKISAKTLIVTGHEDKLAGPDTAKQIAERISGARVEILENTGHWTALEAPERLAKLLAEFLQ